MRETDHSPSKAEVKNGGAYFYLVMRLHGMVFNDGQLYYYKQEIGLVAMGWEEALHRFRVSLRPYRVFMQQKLNCTALQLILISVA